jgi:hypothetical protein
MIWTFKKPFYGLTMERHGRQPGKAEIRQLLELNVKEHAPGLGSALAMGGSQQELDTPTDFIWTGYSAGAAELDVSNCK